MFFISQLGEQDCLFACLKMMLANYHKDRNYLYLKCELDKKYSYHDAVTIASEYNMALQGVKILRPEELFNCKTFPIVVTLNRKKIHHSVLLLKANRKNITVFDPDVGKKKIPTELFFKEWTYRALIVKEITPSKCPIQFPDFIAKKDKITLPILQILSGISLLLGTYFISDTSLFYLPIIFFSVFIIFEILFRNNLVNAMRRMDDEIFSYDFKVEKQDYIELYKTIEKYRNISLTIFPNFIYLTLVSIFITVILVMNATINVIYIILPMVLAFVEVFIYLPIFEQRKVEIVEKESELLEVENDFQFKAKSTEAHSLAYQVGLGRNIYTYLEIAILLITIILTMAITGTIQITYVVFFLCISVFLKRTFSKIMDFSKQSEEYDFARAKLLNSIVEKNNS
ncbi:MAG: hypothetical protein J6M95_00420 [Bacilli bacterium]|nr:hypothetical protein [Bacilli bacterium]